MSSNHRPTVQCKVLQERGYEHGTSKSKSTPGAHRELWRADARRAFVRDSARSAARARASSRSTRRAAGAPRARAPRARTPRAPRTSRRLADDTPATRSARPKRAAHSTGSPAGSCATRGLNSRHNSMYNVDCRVLYMLLLYLLTMILNHEEVIRCAHL